MVDWVGRKRCPGVRLGRGLRIRPRFGDNHGADAGAYLHLARFHPPEADGQPGCELIEAGLAVLHSRDGFTTASSSRGVTRAKALFGTPAV